jgi:hypothetical protein
VTLSATRAAPWAFALLLCACTRPPPPQYALTVRDPDKLCRWIVFSRCKVEARADGDLDGGVAE